MSGLLPEYGGVCKVLSASCLVPECDGVSLSRLSRCHWEDDPDGEAWAIGQMCGKTNWRTTALGLGNVRETQTPHNGPQAGECAQNSNAAQRPSGRGMCAKLRPRTLCWLHTRSCVDGLAQTSPTGCSGLTVHMRGALRGYLVRSARSSGNRSATSGPMLWGP